MMHSAECVNKKLACVKIGRILVTVAYFELMWEMSNAELETVGLKK